MQSYINRCELRKYTGGSFRYRLFLLTYLPTHASYTHTHLFTYRIYIFFLEVFVSVCVYKCYYIYYIFIYRRNSLRVPFN